MLKLLYLFLMLSVYLIFSFFPFIYWLFDKYSSNWPANLALYIMEAEDDHQDHRNAPLFDPVHWAANLKCAVCWKLFDHPKILDCGHTFCRRCIEGVITSSEYPNIPYYRQEFRCPTCRKAFKLRLYDRYSPRNMEIEQLCKLWQLNNSARDLVWELLCLVCPQSMRLPFVKFLSLVSIVALPSQKQLYNKKAMANLGTNPHHQSQILNYLRFARYQRAQRLKAVDMCFDDIRESRLSDDTFTVDEVNEILDSLLHLVRGDIEDELINMSHTNVLLLRQVFQQAEKWHLKLQADISELENKALLDKIKEFEESELSGARVDIDLSAMKLEPMAQQGGAALLHSKIEEMEEENYKLKQRIKELEGKATGIEREKIDLAAKLGMTQSDLEKAIAAAQKAQFQVNDTELEALRSQITQLQAKVQESGKSAKDKEDELDSALAKAKHELLKVQEMLEMAEKELDKKVYNTTPYKNLKKMMQKKNEQIRDFRRRLSKYEEIED